MLSHFSRIAAFLASIPLILSAQLTSRGPLAEVTDSLGGVRLGYERVLNTFTGSGQVIAGGSVSELAYALRQNLRTRLVRVPGSPRQNEYSGSLLITAPLSDGIQAFLREESSVLGGSRGSGLEAIEMHRVLGGTSVEPLHDLRMKGSVGWEWNGQEEFRDKGLSYGASLESGEISLDRLALNGSASWLRSDIGQRRPEDASASIRLRSDFREGSGDSLMVSYKSQVRDLYSSVGPVSPSAQPMILRRAEKVLHVHNTLWFGSGDRLAGNINAGMMQRDIDRTFRTSGIPEPAGLPLPTRIDQLLIDIGGQLRWVPHERVTAHVGTGFSSGEEVHDVLWEGRLMPYEVDQQRAQARRRSNKYDRYTATFTVDVLPLARGMVQLQGGASILKYDTPDTLNTDDRDEQRLTAGLHLAYALGDGLDISIHAEGGQSHLVYLSRFQSANNVKIRTLRLAPSIVWQSPGSFRNALTAEVAASYTVYDYEDLISSVQSFSYRQAAWTDSMIVVLGARTELEFFGSLRLFERGTLRWSEFKERPQRAFLELYVWPRVTYRLWSGVSLGVGFRSFRQERYRYLEQKREYDGMVGSFGPTVSVMAYVGSYGRIAMTGWRETQFVNDANTRSISNLSLIVETQL